MLTERTERLLYIFYKKHLVHRTKDLGLFWFLLQAEFGNIYIIL